MLHITIVKTDYCTFPFIKWAFPCLPLLETGSKETRHPWETEAMGGGTLQEEPALATSGRNHGSSRFSQSLDLKAGHQVHKPSPLSQAVSSDLSLQWMAQEGKDKEERGCSLAHFLSTFLLFAPKINNSNIFALII